MNHTMINHGRCDDKNPDYLPNFDKQVEPRLQLFKFNFDHEFGPFSGVHS